MSSFMRQNFSKIYFLHFWVVLSLGINVPRLIFLEVTYNVKNITDKDANLSISLSQIIMFYAS